VHYEPAHPPVKTVGFCEAVKSQEHASRLSVGVGG
jgi:hypothetical protein